MAQTETEERNGKKESWFVSVAKDIIYCIKNIKTIDCLFCFMETTITLVESVVSYIEAFISLSIKLVAYSPFKMVPMALTALTITVVKIELEKDTLSMFLGITMALCLMLIRDTVLFLRWLKHAKLFPEKEKERKDEAISITAMSQILIVIFFGFFP